MIRHETHPVKRIIFSRIRSNGKAAANILFNCRNVKKKINTAKYFMALLFFIALVVAQKQKGTAMKNLPET
jgi:hypothetical protein